jgi:YggT family protein
MLQDFFNFVIETAASILGNALLLSFWIHAVKVQPPQPIGYFVDNVSSRVTKPLRRFFPDLCGYDCSSLMGAVLVAIISIFLELSIKANLDISLIFGLSALLFFQWSFYGLIASLLIEAAFSWISPNAYFLPFIGALNKPLLLFIRKVIPLIGNIDISLLVALILLRATHHLISHLIISII